MEAEIALKSLGLSHQEAKMYLAVFKLGEPTAAQSTKEAGIQRTAGYPILKSLAEKGLIDVYMKKSRKVFHAQKPSRLSEMFSRKLENFNHLIPEIESLDRRQAEILGLRFIESKNELKNFYEEILAEYKDKQYYIIGNANAWEAIDPEFFVKFRKNRANENIKTKLLLSSDSARINPVEKELLREFKYLPEKYGFKSTIDIYNDKILVISPNISSLAVVIAIPAMVDVFKSMFEIIWDSLPA
jgi:sugar-specific transcriptional regulator TrmB